MKKRLIIDSKDNVPSGTSWKKILMEIYQHAPHMWGESNRMAFSDDNHDLAIKLKISGQELNLGISFLVNNNLIYRSFSPTKDMPYSAQLNLTEKGFNTALEIEKQHENAKVQGTLVILTTVLALTAFYDLANNVITNFNTISVILVITLGIIIILVGIFTFNIILKKY